MLKGLYCRITRHRVNRRRVWNDQLNFRTSCERCGASLLRDRHGWRLFDGKRDANDLRDTHPHTLETASD